MENGNLKEAKKTSLFSGEQLEKIKAIKNFVQKMIIWMLVGGVALGVFLILFAGSEEAITLAKFMGTLFILAGAALSSFLNFNYIERGDSRVQAFATLGVATTIVWAFLWILAVWGIFDIWAYGTCRTLTYSSSNYCPIIGYSPFGILAMIASYLSALGLFGAWTLNIYEGAKRATIRPLKITAVLCLVYVELHSIVRLFIQTESGYTSNNSYNFGARLDILAGFAGFVWFITAIIAWVLSRHEKNAKEYSENKKKQEIAEKAMEKIASDELSIKTPKTDNELRAEIEEKVRREMIEKEIRAKYERELKESEK